MIARSKLNRLELLEIFEARVVVPPAVRRELLSKPESETPDIERALARQIQVHEVPALGTTTGAIAC